MAEPLIVALSELAARVQRGRSVEQVLEIAGRGVRRLGLRLVAFQIEPERDVLVLRHVATAPRRLRALEDSIGRPLRGLSAPLAGLPFVTHVIEGRQNVYREDLDLFYQFLRASTGFDSNPLDATPATAGVANGIIAPIFVGERPWGLLSLVSPSFRAEDAPTVALFATHVGSALEAAEFIAELVRREHLAALGELSAVLAHEVKNPIGAIYNAVTLLGRMSEDRSDDGRELLGIIAEEANRLNEIVSGLLDFARPDGPSPQRASIREIAEDVMAAARARPEASRVELRLDAPGDLPALHVDIRLVRQALLNLVHAGLRAMPGGGVLTLRARLERGTGTERSFALLQVIDTGPGIPVPEHAESAFEPLYSTRATGLGLGLPLVRRVIESHGGEVALESGPSGTTYSLRLPVPPPTRAARAQGRPVRRPRSVAQGHN